MYSLRIVRKHVIINETSRISVRPDNSANTDSSPFLTHKHTQSLLPATLCATFVFALAELVRLHAVVFILPMPCTDGLSNLPHSYTIEMVN